MNVMAEAHKNTKLMLARYEAKGNAGEFSYTEAFRICLRNVWKRLKAFLAGEPVHSMVASDIGKLFDSAWVPYHLISPVKFHIVGSVVCKDGLSLAISENDTCPIRCQNHAEHYVNNFTSYKLVLLVTYPDGSCKDYKLIESC